MPSTSRTETFDVAIEKFYETLIDYEKYPDLLSEVSGIEVLEFSEKKAKVRYEINMIKKFSYILTLTQKRPKELSWELESGDLFKKNSGKWLLTKEGPERTKVDYTLDVDFKVFAPKTITQKLVAHNLPKMMKTFCEHAQSL